MISFDIFDKEQPIEELVVATKIHKERLSIENKMELPNSCPLKLEIDKLYLFFFHEKNIEFIIDGEPYKIEKNALFFENKENNICIINENTSLKTILYIINDRIDWYQKNKDLLESSIHLNINNNNIFLIDCNEILTDDICDSFKKYIDNVEIFDFEKWQYKYNVNAKYIFIEKIKDEKKDFFINITNKLIGFITEYFKTKHKIISNGNSLILLRKIFGPTRIHYDSIINQIIDEKYASINEIRNMSVVIALNDDYEDGEFYFPNQNVKIKLKKGQAIAFPPCWTHPHLVYAPSNGTYRYTLNTWLFQ